jgi:hypothetical protein
LYRQSVPKLAGNEKYKSCGKKQSLCPQDWGLQMAVKANLQARKNRLCMGRYKYRRRPYTHGGKMNSSRLYRGQPKKFDDCLFVPSALRGYWPNHYPFSGIGCCNSCTDIPKVEKFLRDIKMNTEPYKKECEALSKKGPFQNCVASIPYVFWLSIVFCGCKISHAGKLTSFMGGGIVPYSIDMGFENPSGGDCPDGGCLDKMAYSQKSIWSKTVADHALEIARCYFAHTPPAQSDNFIRKYMDHQHYCKCSLGYETFPKAYKLDDGTIMDGNELPDHFTFLLDWTTCRAVAEKFSEDKGTSGTIFSINAEMYDKFVGANYKMSYDDEIIQHFFIDTAEPQKSVVTFWPWVYTPAELIGQQKSGEGLGYELDFKQEENENL